MDRCPSRRLTSCLYAKPSFSFLMFTLMLIAHIMFASSYHGTQPQQEKESLHMHGRLDTHHPYLTHVTLSPGKKDHWAGRLSWFFCWLLIRYSPVVALVFVVAVV